MSDHDKKTEEIKALLRKKLDGLPPAEDGWNVPSKGVWSGLSAELGAKASPKPMSNWAAPIATIIIGLVMILFWRECSNQRQLTGLETEVEKISNAYGKLQEACNEKQSVVPATTPSTIFTAPGGADDISSKNYNLSDKNGPTAAGSVPAKTILKTSRKAEFTSDLSPKNIYSGGASTGIATISEEQEIVAPASPFPPFTIPGYLPFLSLSGLPISNASPKLDLHHANPKDKAAAFMLIASLNGGLALTGNNLSGEKPAIIKDQKSLLTWRAGFGLEAAFNRHWSVLTGVDFSHSHIQTDYQLAVPYTHNGEFQHDDGNFDNQYNHSLPSSFGNYPAELVLTRSSGVDVVEGELMNLDLSIKQKTRFLSLPMQLRYGFGKHRWQVGAKAGIIANHVLGISSEKPILHSNHGAIHERHTSIGTPPLNKLEQWTFDYTLGLDLRYQLSPRFGLSIASAYQKGITPVYQDALVKNYLHAWNLGLGVHYWLR